MAKRSSKDYATLAVYLKNISETKLLTAEEELKLAKKAKKGHIPSKRKLVEANLLFVVKIARSFMNQGLPLLDLIQEGNIGLIEAIDKFEPSKGYRLTTYAAWWIRLAIQRAIEKKSRPVRIPMNKFEVLRKIKKFQYHFSQKNERMPTTEEIAKEFDLKPHKIEALMKLDTAFLSLESADDEDGLPLERFISDKHNENPSEKIHLWQTKRLLKKAMQVLNNKEREVIKWRFGLTENGKMASLRLVGEIIGLSAEGVRRIEEQALTKLRRPVVRAQVEGLI